MGSGDIIVQLTDIGYKVPVSIAVIPKLSPPHIFVWYSKNILPENWNRNTRPNSLLLHPSNVRLLCHIAKRVSKHLFSISLLMSSQISKNLWTGNRPWIAIRVSLFYETSHISAQMRMLTNKLPITTECNNKHLTQTFAAKGVCLEEVIANTNAKVYMELGKKINWQVKKGGVFCL